MTVAKTKHRHFNTFAGAKQYADKLTDELPVIERQLGHAQAIKFFHVVNDALGWAVAAELNDGRQELRT